MNNEIMIVVVIGLIVALLVVFGIIKKGKKVDSSNSLGGFDIDAFLSALGELKNIESCKATNSKISIELQDETKANVEKLKQLGASGIVITGQKVIVILGQISLSVEQYIQERLSR